MHGGAEDIPVLQHHGAEIASDPDRHRLFVDFQRGVSGDLHLHLRGGIQGIVCGWEGRHDFIAHGLDDRTVVLLGRRTHHIDADAHHVARAQITQELVQLGAADDIGKYDREFEFFTHLPPNYT